MPPEERRMIGQVRSALKGAALALCLGCGLQPESEPALGQTVLEMSEALNAVQQETALMQAQIDSLREVVARQDTLV
jgi:hypothetical protein